MGPPVAQPGGLCALTNGLACFSTILLVPAPSPTLHTQISHSRFAAKKSPSHTITALKSISDLPPGYSGPPTAEGPSSPLRTNAISAQQFRRRKLAEIVSARLCIVTCSPPVLSAGA